MLRQKAFKVRLEPDSKQLGSINRTLGCTRFVYNHFLARRTEAYKNKEKHLNYNATSAELTLLKKAEQRAWLGEVDKFALQNSLRDLDRAFKNFFTGHKSKRKVGYPRFKKKGSRESYRTNFTNGNIQVIENYIKLPKLGWIKFRKSQELEGRILSVTITRTPTGKLEAAILCEMQIQSLSAAEREAVGVDLGIKHYLVTSEEEEPYDNPRYYLTLLKKLRKASKALSRCIKGSNGWKKAKTKLAAIHYKIANLRRDFLHKLTTKLIRNYSLIAVEDLRVANMVRNRKLARSVLDAGWAEFIRQLEYKALWYGRTLIKVDPFFPSSQLCHQCNYKNPAVKNLAVRTWTCPHCNSRQDRDKNAAINIKQYALRLVAAGCSETLNACGEHLNPAPAGSVR